MILLSDRMPHKLVRKIKSFFSTVTADRPKKRGNSPNRISTGSSKVQGSSLSPIVALAKDEERSLPSR
jgi:hypothetical protein